MLHQISSDFSGREALVHALEYPVHGVGYLMSKECIDLAASLLLGKLVDSDKPEVSYVLAIREKGEAAPILTGVSVPLPFDVVLLQTLVPGLLVGTEA